MLKKLFSSLTGAPAEEADDGLDMLFFQCQISIRDQLHYLKLWPPLSPTALDAEYKKLLENYQYLYQVIQQMTPLLARLEEEFDTLTLQAEMNQLEQFVADLEQVLIQSGELVAYRQELEAEYQNILKVKELIQKSHSEDALNEAYTAFENLLDRRDALSDKLEYFEEREIAIQSVQSTFEAFKYQFQILEHEIDEAEKWIK